MIQRRRIGQNLFVILISCLLFTCQQDEVTPREYPRVTTHEVGDISSAGVIFRAEITYPGNGSITGHGFVWSTAQGANLESADYTSLGTKPGNGTFAATVTHALKKGATYYVRAYAKGNGYLVYGKEVSFESQGSQPPEIHAFYPETGTTGDTIVLRGAGFSLVNYNNIVKLDTLSAYMIEVSDTAVKAIIPQGLRTKSSGVSITVTGNTTTAEEKFHLSTPALIEFTPKTGKAGDTVTIKGKNFSHYPTENVVAFNDIIAQKSSENDEELKVLVPSGLENPVKLSVSVAGQPASFSDEFTYLKPQIKTFSPDSATYGDTLTLYGEHFIESSDLKVKFENDNYYKNAEIVEVTPDMIKVIVPLDMIVKQANISIYLSEVKFTYPNIFKYLAPEIYEIVPSEFSFGDTIIIKGKNFHPSDDGNRIYFKDSYTWANVIKDSREEIWVEIPSNINLYDGTARIEVRVADFSLYESIKLAPPVITDFYPKEVANLTDRITIIGKYFNPVNYRNVVYLGEEEFRLEVVSASSNEIIAEVAGGIKDPLITHTFTDYLYVETEVQSAKANDPLKVEYIGKWTQKADFPGQGRRNATSFVINDKAYVGLGYQRIDDPFSWVGYNDVWEYDPDADQWTQKADFPGSPRFDAETFTIEGKGYVGMGYYFSDPAFEMRVDFWEYDPVANKWTQKGDFPGNGRLEPIGFSLGSKGYIGGGRSSGYTLYKDFWEYDAQSDQWNQKNNIDIFDVLSTNLDGFNYYTTSYSALNKGYCLVGMSSYRKQFVYNPESDQWSLLGDYPMSEAVQPTGFVINNLVYFQNYNQLYYYDIAGNTWSQGDYRGGRRVDGISFSIKGKGYIGWGTSFSNQLTDLWEYDPSR